jgi:hypothetical protein
VDNVSILYDICLAFLSILARCFDRSHTLPTLTQIVEILIGANFGFNKAALEVAVDCTGCGLYLTLDMKYNSQMS